jgi:hypothetical protein
VRTYVRRDTFENEKKKNIGRNTSFGSPILLIPLTKPFSHTTAPEVGLGLPQQQQQQQ